MIIKGGRQISIWNHRAIGVGTVLVGIVVTWFGGMAILMLSTDLSVNALVIGPGVKILRKTQPDVKILRAGERIMVLTSKKQGYVRDLYAAGAWLVLPSLSAGCLDINRFGLSRVPTSLPQVFAG